MYKLRTAASTSEWNGSTTFAKQETWKKEKKIHFQLETKHSSLFQLLPLRSSHEQNNPD